VLLEFKGFCRLKSGHWFVLTWQRLDMVGMYHHGHHFFRLVLKAKRWRALSWRFLHGRTTPTGPTGRAGFALEVMRRMLYNLKILIAL